MGEFDRPFRASETRLTRHDLRHDYTRIYRDVYVRKGIHVDARVRAIAAAIFAIDGVLCGRSAAVLHGTKWVDDDSPAEVIRPTGSTKAPQNLIVRGDRLRHDEVRCMRRLSVTTPARTAFDLGRRLPYTEAVATLDALFRATRLEVAEVEVVAANHSGARGSKQLRQVLAAVDCGAESPQETATRLLLIQAGLPKPGTQRVITDEFGRFVASVDLAWDRWRVIVEYDGEHHWSDRHQRSRDIDRIARLEDLGWKVIRVSAELLRDRPGVVVTRVRDALVKRGWTPSRHLRTGSLGRSIPISRLTAAR